MVARVIEARRVGFVLQMLQNRQEVGQCWLPVEELANQPDETQFLSSMYEKDDELDVVQIHPSGGADNLPVVSLKRLTRADLTSDTRFGTRLMRVNSLSRMIIRGKVGPLAAVMDLNKYHQFFYQKRLGQQMLDHTELARGDYIAGIVTGVTTDLCEPSDCLELDPGQYLEQFEAYLSQEESDVSSDKKSNTDEVRRMLAVNDPAIALPKDIIAKVNPVLIVENSQTLAESVERLLKSEGLTVHKETTFESARLIAEQRPPTHPDGVPFRLAILDPNLEDNGTDQKGLKLAQMLSETPDLAILLVTAEKWSSSKRERWGSLPANGYLEKVFHVGSLFEAIGSSAIAERSPIKDLLPPEPEQLDTGDPPPTEGEPASSGDDSFSLDAIQRLLQDLTRLKKNMIVHVFEIHPRSRRGRSFRHQGEGLKWEIHRSKISKSPIRDAAFARNPIFETVSLSERSHLYTQIMMDYKSFFGLSLNVPGHMRHALVGFHPEPHAFDEEPFQLRAQLCGAQIARLLERSATLKYRDAQTVFASTGMALECLSHELFSEISASNADAHTLGKSLGVSTPTELVFPEVQKLAKKIADDLIKSTGKIAALRGCRTERETVSVQESLKRAATACHALCNKFLAEDERLVISIPSYKPEEEVYAKAPPAALIIVFFNIYLNAVQQMQLMRAVRTRGEVRHTFQYLPVGGTAGWAVVHIHDTGPGIHREDFSRVMQPGHSTKPAGTGMGLHICRSLLNHVSDKERMATLAITRSVIWKGTTFTIRLPLVPRLSPTYGLSG